jgi:hypothetical protein
MACEGATGCNILGVTVPSIGFNISDVSDAVVGIATLQLPSLSPEDHYTQLHTLYIIAYFGNRRPIKTLCIGPGSRSLDAPGFLGHT